MLVANENGNRDSEEKSGKSIKDFEKRKSFQGRRDYERYVGWWGAEKEGGLILSKS